MRARFVALAMLLLPATGLGEALPADAHVAAADGGAVVEPSSPSDAGGSEGGAQPIPAAQQADGSRAGRKAADEDVGAPGSPDAGAAKPEPPAKVLDEKETVEDDGYRVSLSLPTEEDRVAWTHPGLRVELAAAQGLLFASGPAPRITTTAFQLRTRLRLDELWSLSASFSYAIAGGTFTGLRWTALVEPMFHPLPSMGLSLGVGYGGLAINNANATNRPPPGGSEEYTSRSLDDSERMYSCQGGGWVSQARVEYLMVVGPLFATGPYLQADMQLTACEESFGSTDRETGRPALGRQYWLQGGGALGWWLSWR